VSSLIFSTGASWSQSATQERADQAKKPSFAVAARTVLVDVVVRDGKDRHVRDLRPEEFELYENGVKQHIDSAEIQDESGAWMAKGVEYRKGQPPAPPAVTPSSVFSPAAAPAAPRVNLITFLMDFSTTEFTNQKYVREAAVKYIKEKIGENDLVAVYATGAGDLRALQPFTADKALLMRCLAKADLSGTTHKGERVLADATVARERQIGSAISGLSPSLAGGADNVSGAPLLGADGRSAYLRSMLGQRIADSFTALRSFTDSMVARPVLAALKSIALAQQDIPGRKTLVLFSQGFVVPPSVEGVMRDAVDAANKANLAIYSIDVQGLKIKEGSMRGELDSINAASIGNVRGLTGAQTVSAGPGGVETSTPANANPSSIGAAGTRASSSAGESLFDKARQVGSDQEESSLRFITNSTGGFLIRNTNDFASGLLRIDEDVRTYYLLSYRPANQDFDGKFREIRVEVTRPGLRVRSRSGYYAISSRDTLLTLDQRALFTAARERKSPPALAIYATSDEFFPEKGVSAAVVTVDISADTLKLTEDGSGFQDSLQIMGLVSDETGRSVTTFGRSLPLQFNKDQMDAARGGYISHSESVALQPGKYNIEILAHEASTNNYGYYFQEVSLQPPAGFALSDLVLSHQIVKAAPEVKSDPLVIGEAIILPSASRQFRNGDRLIFYFDIYHAGAGDTRSNVEVTLSLKRDGRPLPAKLPSYMLTEPLKPGRERIQVAKYLELTGLPPGNYSLMVTAKDLNAGASSFAESPFTLVR